YFFDKNENNRIDDVEILLLFNYWAQNRILPPMELPTSTPTPTPEPGPDEWTIELPGLPADAKKLELARIPAGTFMMGSPEDEQDRASNEGPQHSVTLTREFYLGKYEVTQAQWQAVMGRNPALGYGVGNNYPVNRVSWDDCQEFLRRLNEMGVGTFRLPTEAEWEYACRAGTTTRFYWGEDPNHSMTGNYAWYADNSSGGSREVGLKLPNAWGLFDMSGNVYEWCADWYEDYPNQAQTDPSGPASGAYRMIRGGVWDAGAGNCRSAHRNYSLAGFRYHLYGFRLLKTHP
ncbi:MAG: formylglycine-generating enzyme family protein, partial [Candidatus Omnitrophota bacterium]